MDDNKRPYNRKPRSSWLVILTIAFAVVAVTGAGTAWWALQIKEHTDHALKKLFFDFCVVKYQVYKSKDDQAKADKLCKDVWDASLASNISPFLFTKVVAVESAFQCDAVSYAGAFGCAQVLARTWKEKYPDMYSQRGNLFAGAAILRQYLDLFGEEKLALTAYNRGPSMVWAILRGGGNPNENGYAQKVYDV